MSVSREELERALLSNPFNVELRTQYAQVLLESGDPQAAFAQFELLLSQSATNAAAQVGAALALLQLGRDSEALQRYAAARNIPGFTSDPTLESRLEKP
jgi:Flp pilus assembly protein TadD